MQHRMNALDDVAGIRRATICRPDRWVLTELQANPYPVFCRNGIVGEPFGFSFLIIIVGEGGNSPSRTLSATRYSRLTTPVVTRWRGNAASRTRGSRSGIFIEGSRAPIEATAREAADPVEIEKSAPINGPYDRDIGQRRGVIRATG